MTIADPGFFIPNSLFKKHGDPVRYWAARAIFDDRGQIDLVSDRQTSSMRSGDTRLITAAGDAKVNELYHWIDTVGLPWLRKEAVRLEQNSEETIIFTQPGGRFSIAASPSKSYGYLYINAMEHFNVKGQYELDKPDPTAKWSGKTIPAIEERVKVTMNNFGDGTVIGYCVTAGHLGLHIKVDRQPDWHVKQGGRKYIIVYGAEVQAL